MTAGWASVNAEQVDQWNGQLGRFWIDHRERHQTAHQYLVSHLLSAAQISPGERVLDVGCGCGPTTVEAARAARGVSRVQSAPRRLGRDEVPLGGCAIGLDVSGLMLEVARRLAAEADVPNIRFIQGDAQFCPVRRHSCDVVISSFGVMFFADPAKAFTNIAGVLRPNGRLAFLCWQDDSRNEFTSIPLRVFGKHMPLPPPAGSDRFNDPHQISELLSGTGWEKIEIAALNKSAWMGCDVDDVMKYVKGIPVIRRLSRTLANDIGRIRTEQVLSSIADQYAARQRPNGIWVHAAAWLVSARRA